MADFQDAFSYTSGASLTTRNGDYTRYASGSGTASLSCTGSTVDWDQNDSGGFIVYKYTGISPGAAQYSEVKVSTGEPYGRGSGVAVRVQNSTDCYMLTIRSGRLTMGKLVSGTYTEFAGANGTYTGGPYTLRLEVDSAHNLTGYLDGVETLTYDDTGDTYSSGSVGIASEGCGDDIYLDDFDAGDLATSAEEEVSSAMTALLPTMAAELARNNATDLETRGFTVTVESDYPITVVTFEDGIQGAVLHASATNARVVDYVTPQGGPSATPDRNGAMIDPTPSWHGGYDDRDSTYAGGDIYDSGLNVGLDIANGTPVDVTPPSDSYVSFCVASSCAGTPPSPGDNPLERWVPFPIIHSGFAPANASITYAPWAAGPIKQSEHYTTAMHSTETLLAADLEAVDSYFDATLLSNIKTDMAALWCDHCFEFASRLYHPVLDMPGTGYGATLEYARELSRRCAEALTMLHSDLADAELVRCVIRQGLNFYGNRANGGVWGPNGGHGQGRKAMWLAAWRLLGQPSSIDPFADDSANTNEDGQSYIATDTSPPEGEVNDGYGNRLNGDPLQVGDAAWGINHSATNANDDFDYVTPDSNGAYARINLPNWHLTAWAFRKLSGSLLAAKSVWDHDAFWDVVEEFHTVYSEHANTYTWATALWDDPSVGYDAEGTAFYADADMEALLPIMEADAMVGHGVTSAMSAPLPTMLCYAMKGGTSFGDGGITAQKVRRIMAHKRFMRARR